VTIERQGEPHDSGDGLSKHIPRRSDVDPRAAKRAERQVALLFLGSGLASVLFIVFYIQTSTEEEIRLPGFGYTNASNLLLGITMGLALFLIGAAAIHWSKKLMSDVEVVEDRGAQQSTDEAKSDLLVEFRRGVDESSITRRPLIVGSMAAALGLVGLPAIVLLRDLGPLPGKVLEETMWEPGLHILVAETHQKIRPQDLEVGTLVSAVPEGIDEVMHEEGNLNALAKAAVMLIRMDPSEIVADQTPEGEDSWTYEGILCFSKICTHVGCALGLYEQLTHHMLCPCHQSTFDLADKGNVIFGPAARSLPQLAITVDEDGYLIAREGFTEPVGPSFWERG
jgi:ubiquinol-cytochrome c reductase iron-sulfur subunit